MSKYAKIMISCFVAGILLVGIGCGVACFEFSAINYGGDKVMASTAKPVTDTYEEEIDSNLQNITLEFYDDKNTTVNIVSDQTIPTNKIIFEVSHPSGCYVSYGFSVIDDDANDYDNYDDYADNEYSDDYNGSLDYDHDGDNDYDDYVELQQKPSSSSKANAQFGLDNQDYFQIIRQAITDLKNDQIYKYVYKQTITVKVNPVNAGKISYGH